MVYLHVKDLRFCQVLDQLSTLSADPLPSTAALPPSTPPSTPQRKPGEETLQDVCPERKDIMEKVEAPLWCPLQVLHHVRQTCSTALLAKAVKVFLALEVAYLRRLGLHLEHPFSSPTAKASAPSGRPQRSSDVLLWGEALWYRIASSRPPSHSHFNQPKTPPEEGGNTPENLQEEEGSLSTPQDRRNRWKVVLSEAVRRAWEQDVVVLSAERKNRFARAALQSDATKPQPTLSAFLTFVEDQLATFTFQDYQVEALLAPSPKDVRPTNEEECEAPPPDSLPSTSSSRWKQWAVESATSLGTLAMSLTPADLEPEALLRQLCLSSTRWFPFHSTTLPKTKDEEDPVWGAVRQCFVAGPLVRLGLLLQLLTLAKQCRDAQECILRDAVVQRGAGSGTLHRTATPSRTAAPTGSASSAPSPLLAASRAALHSEFSFHDTALLLPIRFLEGVLRRARQVVGQRSEKDFPCVTSPSSPGMKRENRTEEGQRDAVDDAEVLVAVWKACARRAHHQKPAAPHPSSSERSSRHPWHTARDQQEGGATAGANPKDEEGGVRGMSNDVTERPASSTAHGGPDAKKKGCRTTTSPLGWRPNEPPHHEALDLECIAVLVLSPARTPAAPRVPPTETSNPSRVASTIFTGEARRRKNDRVDLLQQASTAYYYDKVVRRTGLGANAATRCGPTTDSDTIRPLYEKLFNMQRFQQYESTGDGWRRSSRADEEEKLDEQQRQRGTGISSVMGDLSIGLDMLLMLFSGAAIGYFLGMLRGASETVRLFYMIIGVTVMLFVDGLLLIAYMTRGDRKAAQALRRREKLLQRVGKKAASPARTRTAAPLSTGDSSTAKKDL